LYAFGIEEVDGPVMQALLHGLIFLTALDLLPRRTKPGILAMAMELETIK
jgi:hypothetical protein